MRQTLKSHACLDAVMKQLTARGIGTMKKQAQPVMEANEKRLWDSGVTSVTCAQSWSYGVFYYNCKAFGFRGFDDHHSLETTQYSFDCDELGDYVTFSGKVCKNYQGGIHKTNPSQKQYSSASDPNRCTVKLFQSYLTSLPMDGTSHTFYHRPLPNKVDGKIQFNRQVAGVNRLKCYMKEMCTVAGLEGTYTNHSGKVTQATSLYQKGFDEQAIMARTGHRSTAVRAYKRPSNAQLKDV